MNPVATALFVVGYGLAVPIGLRMATVVAEQHRLAVWGHQLGVLIAALGWLLRGGVFVTIIHLAWMAFVSVWFGFQPVVSRARGREKG